MIEWLKLNPKIAAAIIMTIILVAAAPQIAAAGINLSDTWKMVLVVFAGYMTPSGGQS